MLQDRVNSLPGPVDEVEDTVGQTGLLEQLAEPDSGERRPLGGLEDVSVPGAYGDGQGPQGHHAREVEWRYGRHHPQRVAVGGVVYPPGHVPHRLAHKERRHPAGELHHLDSPAHLTGGVLGVLAVLQGHEVPQLLEVLLEERLEAEEHLGALHHRRPRPAREGRLGRLHRPVDVLPARERRLGYDLAGGRVVDGLGLAPVALLPGTPYKVPDLQVSLA